VRAAEFKAWLTGRFRGRDGSPMSAKAASDAASRCRRVEDTLDIDLDDAVATESSFVHLLKQLGHGYGCSSRAGRRFKVAGQVQTGMAALRHAVKLYARFAKGTLWKVAVEGRKR